MLLRMEWEASKETHKSKILGFDWMQHMEKWFGRWDTTPINHDIEKMWRLIFHALTTKLCSSPN